MLEESIKKELERDQGKTKAKRPVKHIPGLVQNPEPTVLKKVTNALIEEDLKTASTSVLDDILIPTVKNLMADMFVGVIERVFRGNSRKPATGGGYYTNYSNSLVRTHTASGTNYSNVTTIRQQQPQEQPVREKLTYSNIVMRDRPSAQGLIDTLAGELVDHDSVTIAELYEMLTDDNSVVYSDPTDNYYGWKSMEGAYIKPYGGQFKVILPKPIQLD